MTYTGMGLLAAGMFNVLAWHFGPVEAEQIVADHLNWLIELPADKSLEFRDYAIFSSPGLLNALSEQGLRDRYHPVPRAGFTKSDLRQDAKVIFPLGALVQRWAVGAMLETAKQTPAEVK